MNQASPHVRQKSQGSAAGALAMGLWRKTRRIAILVIGLTVILIGLVLLVTPGPAMLVIPAGLAILATEFVWARRLLKRMKESAAGAYDAARGRRAKASDKPQSLPGRCTSRICEIWHATIGPFRAIQADAPHLLLPPSSQSSSSVKHD